MAEVTPRLLLPVLLAASSLAFGLAGPDATAPKPLPEAAQREVPESTEAMRAGVLGGATWSRPASWKRVFNDDFAGSTASWRRWGRCHWWVDGGCTIESNDELEWYLPANVSVGGGRLRLEAREEAFSASDGKDYDYTSGMVSTGPPRYEEPPRFGFTYGYVEARLRLPAERGLWPAFWLLPADSESRPEIDVLETLGQTPDRARFHYHYVDRGGRRRSLGDDWRSSTLADGGWHRYAVDWRPGSITWIVDGRARWRVTGASVADEPLYVVLNLAVGGIYPGPPDETTDLPAAVEADWIRVWQDPRFVGAS